MLSANVEQQNENKEQQPVAIQGSSSSSSSCKQRTVSFDAPTPQNTPSLSNPIGSASSFAQLINNNKNPTNISSILAQSPEIMAALQEKIGGLVNKSSGYVESLPGDVQRRLGALRKLQRKQDLMDAKMEAEIRSVERKYFDMKSELLSKRGLIVRGEYEPKDDEVAGASAIEKPAGDLPPPVKGVPGFWLTALQNAPYFAEQINENDAKALQYLTDMRVKYEKEEHRSGFAIEFEFDSDNNEYFENKVLTKTYYVTEPQLDGVDELDDEDMLDLEPVFSHAQGTEIAWRKDKNLTVSTVVKKQRHKQTNKVRTVKKTVKIDSFFNFFTPPTPPEDGEDDDEELEEDEDEELQDLVEQDYEAGEFLKTRFIPDALKWFTGEALDDEDDDDDEFDSEEEDDDDDDAEDDEDDDAQDDDKPAKRSIGSSSHNNNNSHAAAAQGGEKPECKQQ